VDQSTVSRNASRCVLIVDADLPRWLVANSAAVLGVALGAHGYIAHGPDLPDSSGSMHPGIGVMPLPILAASASDLPGLRQKALDARAVVIDFNAAARDSRTYPEYEDKLARDVPEYLGIAVHGPAAVVTSLTGNLKSLR